MTASTKVKLVIGFFVCANLAVWGAKQMLAAAFDPVLIRALGV